MSQRLLTFELSKDGEELTIHVNAEGVRTLVRVLDRLRSKAEIGKREHEHLMTEAWGGSELSAELKDPEARLINKVDIYVWPETNDTGAN